MRLTRKKDTPKKSKAAFTCLRCGKCCMGDGFVNLSKSDCEKIARFLELSVPEFLERYTAKLNGYEPYLIDGEEAGKPCVFLRFDAKGLSSCILQGWAKPEQCKDFPRKWRLPGVRDWCAGLIAEEQESADGRKK